MITALAFTARELRMAGTIMKKTLRGVVLFGLFALGPQIGSAQTIVRVAPPPFLFCKAIPHH
jgi:hypothetical protein